MQAAVPVALVTPPLILLCSCLEDAVCVLLEFALKHFIFSHKFNLVLFVLLAHGANCGQTSQVFLGHM